MHLSPEHSLSFGSSGIGINRILLTHDKHRFRLIISGNIERVCRKNEVGAEEFESL